MASKVERFSPILLKQNPAEPPGGRNHNGIFDPVSVFDLTSGDCVEETGERAPH